jgi:TolB-like protein
MDLQFGHYLLKRAERQLVGPQGPVELSARSFDILALLLDKPDEVIGKEQLFEAVWPRLVVEENTLQVHISALRKALDTGMITTVHGRGYKYAGPRPVAKSGGSGHSDPASPTATGQPAQSKPSIAVLPFDNLSGDPEQQYFSDGISEDVIRELSRFHSLIVIARHSSFAFRGKQLKMQEIGHELGVDYIVEGSVRRSGERLRLSVQLIKTRSDSHVWAERYDRNVHDIFNVQDELVNAIAATIGAKLEAVGRESATKLSPSELRAHELLLRAKAHGLNYTKEDLVQARLLARKAIDLDPSNAQAHACNAYFCSIVVYSNWASDCDQVRAESFDFARRAIALDVIDTYVRWVLGFVYLTRRDYEEARIHLEKAVEINPNDTEARGVYAIFLVSVGDAESAIRHFDVIKRLNPFDLSWFPWMKGWAFLTLRQYDKAVAEFRKIPEPHNEVRGLLAASLAYLGKSSEAQAMMENFLLVAEADMAVFPSLRPNGWDDYWRNTTCYREQDDHDHLMIGLRSAGLPA